MLPPNPSVAARFIFTLLAVALATLFRYALDPILDLKVPFILYFPTVVLCAWFGGLWQGLLSSALGSLIAWYIFFLPQYSFTVTDPTAPAQVIIFSLSGMFVSLLAENLHRARRQTGKSEATEQEQRQRFRVTLASIGDAVIATDARGRVNFMNPIAASLTGWKDADALGKPLTEVFKIVNEQTRQQVENQALRALKEGVIFGMANHTLLIAKDGSELPIDDSGAPIKDADGKTLGAVLIFRDITERRRVEKERALLAGIVGSSEDAIISKSLDGIVESWNAAAERLFEYTANEAIGQPIKIIIPPERVEEEQLILERLRRGERIEHFETVRQAKSGRLVDISLTVSPVRDDAGRIVGASKIARDITERKRAGEALRQQREWLRVTLSSIGDAVIATDTDGSVTFLNPIAESLTGWKREEAQGQPLEKVFNIVNEQSRKPVENPALRAMREGIIVGLANHTVLIAKDGTERPIDDSGSPIKTAEGKILGAVLIFRDVTERRSAEEALRAKEAELEAIINQTPFMLTRCSRDLRYRFVSHAYAELIGRRPEEITGKPIVEIMGEEGFKAVLPHVERVLEGSRVEFERVVHYQGIGPRFMQAVYTPELDEQGGVKGWIASILDITERKQAEEDRSRLLASERAAREQAETASRAKDEFVALVSHEIRSPLNSILGWVQLLRTDKFDREETQRALETIERNAKTQVQLIEDLLDISRVVTGKLTLQVRPVELTQIIELALDSIRPAAEAKRIQLQVRLATLGSTVTGDPARLQQIIWNLLSNAVKFTPEHGRIEIRMERTDSHLHFTVSDSGVGISPKFLPYVFDRFSQANTSSERKYGGLGLGLAIVRHLVELHGGTVSADSLGEGQGATFALTLPVRAMQEETAEFKRIFPSAESLASLTETIKLDGLRIMVVDDEAESRELLVTMLTRRGAEVIACASATEALSALTEWRPAVLVSDIGMPEEDGYSLIRKLRALDPARGGNVPAVALTGYARNEDRMRALAAGFQMHVPKPVEAAELIVVIASLAGRLDKSGAD